jgi:hypothetical protein
MRQAGAAVVLAIVFSTGQAHAQPKPAAPPSGKKDAPQTYSFERNRIGTETAAVARARFAAGDCAAALDAFDEALRHSVEPTLYRDRGQCHEKLGHVFPAIDDYRAYLSAAPDAKDAEEFRQRLARLEAAGPGEGGEPKGAGAIGARCEARADCQAGLVCVGNRCSDGREGAACETNADCGEGLTCLAETCRLVKVEANTKQSEAELDENKYSQAQFSPLRQGRGLVFGFTTWPRAAIALSGSGKPEISQTFAATLRYSFHKTSTIALDAGYMFIGTPGRLSSGDGPMVALGYEARIGLDRYTTHALLLGAYVGYEAPETRGTRQRVHWFVPRGRVGYRVVLGASFGLELTADVGPAFLFAGGASSQLLLLGGSVGLVVGF